MRYIDAKKLIKAIEEKGLDCSFALKMERLDTLALIDELQQEQIDMGEVSDGYHTFNELYYYRMLYNAAFFNLLPKGMAHKSKRHHDGEECFGGGWFIVMANLPTGQISNHYELKDWDLFQIPEKEFADEWDGHTPQEAAERLRKYLQQEQPDVHYTKRNSLFDKCVENCEPKVMKEVSDNIDKLKSISTPAEEDWFKISEEWENEDKKSATWRDELIKSSKALFYDIDKCITALLMARFDKNEQHERKALSRMESLMVDTQQHLSCIVDYLEKHKEDK